MAGLPGLPGFNTPPPPGFNYTPYSAPTMESVLGGADYQARLNSANRSLERSAAAKGMLSTGNTLANMSELNSNFASQAYDQELQRSLASWDRQYRGQYDAFAPQLEGWRIRANTLAGMNRDRYNADLGLFVNNNSGGGGDGFDPSQYWGDVMPPAGAPAPPAYGAAPNYPNAGEGGPGGGGGQYHGQRAGDPWTEYY